MPSSAPVPGDPVGSGADRPVPARRHERSAGPPRSTQTRESVALVDRDLVDDLQPAVGIAARASSSSRDDPASGLVEQDDPARQLTRARRGGRLSA